LIDDTRTEREVRNLLVRCAFVIEGCDWAGECRDFEAHQKSCLYATDRELLEMVSQSEGHLPDVLEQLAEARKQADVLRELCATSAEDILRLEQALKDTQLQLRATSAHCTDVERERAVDLDPLAKAAAEAEGLQARLALAHEQVETLREVCAERAQDILRLEQALKHAEVQLSVQCAEVSRMQQERAVDLERLAKAAAEAEELQARLVEAHGETDLHREAAMQMERKLVAEQTLKEAEDAVLARTTQLTARSEQIACLLDEVEAGAQAKIRLDREAASLKQELERTRAGSAGRSSRRTKYRGTATED
jgi:chromosome segregation ATPase